MKRFLSRLLGPALIAMTISTAAAQSIEVGADLPAVASVDQDGKEVKFPGDAAKGLTLVYFYPKADTPGCTAQGCSLRDAYEKLTEKGVKVYGVSADKAESQKAFKDKYKLPFTLLADKEGKVIESFKVKKNLLGMASRQAFLFNDGKVVWKDESASTKEQADDVLKAIESLSELRKK